MTNTETTKDVVKKETGAVAHFEQRASVVDSADIVVPRLLLAQGLSMAVSEGRAKMGDISNSLTTVVIGGPGKPIPFIPITIKKYWKRFEVVNNKKQFRGIERFTKDNANRPLKEELPSQANSAVKAQWEFDLTIDVFGFTEEDVQDPIALPAAISFSRTSYKAGQQVNTLLASVEAVNLPYFTYLMEVSCSKKQNDKGIFYTFDVKPKIKDGKMEKTPEAYYAKIQRWSNILTDSNTNVVVDEGEEETTSGVSTSVDESRF